MKILHVLYSGLGGHGNVFFSMVKADTDKEIEYEALFYGIEEIKNEYIEQCLEYGIKYFFVKKEPGLDIGYYALIYKYIKKSSPDIVFLHGSAYILPTKIASFFSKKHCKIVVRETQPNHLKTKAQWVNLNFAMLLADKIVCLTKEFNDQIRKKIPIFYRNKKVIVISNGIDLTVFKPKNWVENKVEFYIGMQSRIVNTKDHFTLLKAFEIVKRSQIAKGKTIKLIIAGDGELKEQMIKLSKELEINGDVIFTGVLQEEKLVIFLQSLDLYIHASLGETMSTAIMQAMACGLPMIASDVDGINNMIKKSVTGILVPSKNESSLANAINDCIKDPEKTQSLAKNAHQYAINNFSNKTMFEKYKKDVFIL